VSGGRPFLDADLGTAMTALGQKLPSRLPTIRAPKNTKFSRDPTRHKAARCRMPCKVQLPNRTKVFHVKHFGTIAGEFLNKFVTS
jgi:hypothetical protein